MYHCIYTCHQWAQVHVLQSVMSHISEHLRALKVQLCLSVHLSLSLLIKHEEEQWQREDRMRKEARGQHNDRTIKTWKRIGLCAYNRAAARERMSKHRDGKNKIHPMINYHHCVPETRWGKRTAATGGIDKNTDLRMQAYTMKQSHEGFYQNLRSSASQSLLNSLQVVSQNKRKS